MSPRGRNLRGRRYLLPEARRSAMGTAHHRRSASQTSRHDAAMHASQPFASSSHCVSSLTRHEDSPRVLDGEDARSSNDRLPGPLDRTRRRSSARCECEGAHKQHSEQMQEARLVVQDCGGGGGRSSIHSHFSILNPKRKREEQRNILKMMIKTNSESITRRQLKWPRNTPLQSY